MRIDFLWYVPAKLVLPSGGTTDPSAVLMLTVTVLCRQISTCAQEGVAEKDVKINKIMARICFIKSTFIAYQQKIQS